MTGEKDEKVYLRTRIPKDIHREFKKASVDEGRTMEDITADLISDWLYKRSISHVDNAVEDYGLTNATFLTMLANNVRPSDTDILRVAQGTNIEIELLQLLRQRLFHDTVTKIEGS